MIDPPDIMTNEKYPTTSVCLYFLCITKRSKENTGLETWAAMTPSRAEATIYADCAPDPIRVPMCLHFRKEEVVRTIKELELDYEKALKKELDELFHDDEKQFLI